MPEANSLLSAATNVQDVDIVDKVDNVGGDTAIVAILRHPSAHALKDPPAAELPAELPVDHHPTSESPAAEVPSKLTSAETEHRGYRHMLDIPMQFHRSIERQWVNVGKQKPSFLLSMSTGQSLLSPLNTNNDTPQLLWSQPPFSTIKKRVLKEKVIPSNKELHDEVQRRAHFLLAEWRLEDTLRFQGQPIPTTMDNNHGPLERFHRPPSSANWTRLRLEKWLTSYPLQLVPSDVTFFQSRLEHIKAILREATQSAQRLSNNKNPNARMDSDVSSNASVAGNSVPDALTNSAEEVSIYTSYKTAKKRQMELVDYYIRKSKFARTENYLTNKLARRQMELSSRHTTIHQTQTLINMTRDLQERQLQTRLNMMKTLSEVPIGSDARAEILEMIDKCKKRMLATEQRTKDLNEEVVQQQAKLVELDREIKMTELEIQELCAPSIQQLA